MLGYKPLNTPLETALKTKFNLKKSQHMYTYEFVRIELKSGFLKKIPRKDYQEVISDYAKKGWKFKQIFAPAIYGYGSATYFELIFEKEV